MMFKTLLCASALMLPVAAMAQANPATTEPAPQESTAPAQGTAPGQVVAATADDVKVGVVVNDQAGQNVGKIEAVSADGAVIATGKSRAQVPLNAFAKKDGTLVIGMTKDQLDAAVAAQKKPSS